MAELPLGYRFKPTNTQLIEYYLTRKLKRQPLPSPNPIIDCNVYSDHPFNILVDTKGIKEDETGGVEGYFFCCLKKVSPNGKKINRSIIGHGTWSNKSKPKDVYDEAMRMIGTVRYFKFEPDEEKKNEPVNKIEWKMHEYSVAKNDLVLCHITNKVDFSTNNVGISRGLKRGTNYEIGSSSKHCRVEYKSPECTSTTINNPAQDEVEVGHQVMDYGFQNQQYYMPHHSLRQQYVMPHQQDTMPHGVPNEVQYAPSHGFPDQFKYDMPHQQYALLQGHGLPDQQYTMYHGHESATNNALVGMITNDQPPVAQGGMYCNDEQGATSHSYSFSDCVCDNVQVPQQEYQIHDEQAFSLPSVHEELSEEVWVQERGSVLNDEEKCDTQNDDNGHEEMSIKALTEEIEGMMNNDKKNVPNYHADEDTTDEAFIEELEGIPSDPHEAQGDELYDEQDMTTSEPHLVQVEDGYNQDMKQVQPEEVETYETHQDPAFSMGNNGIQEDTSWRYKLGFEHEDDEVDFSSWLPALVAA